MIGGCAVPGKGRGKKKGKRGGGGGAGLMCLLNQQQKGGKKETKSSILPSCRLRDPLNGPACAGQQKRGKRKGRKRGRHGNVNRQ